MLDQDIDIKKFIKAILYTILITSPMAYVFYSTFHSDNISPWITVGWSLVTGLAMAIPVVDYMKAHGKLKPNNKK